MANDVTTPPSNPVQKTPATFGDIVAPRLDLVFTLLMDGVVIAVAIVVRWGLLWVYHIGTKGTQSTFLTLLEVILDIGLVATAVAMTAFDLAKRVRASYRSFKQGGTS